MLSGDALLKMYHKQGRVVQVSSVTRPPKQDIWSAISDELEQRTDRDWARRRDMQTEDLADEYETPSNSDISRSRSRTRRTSTNSRNSSVQRTRR
jgi:hypothetical protein